MEKIISMTLELEKITAEAATGIGYGFFIYMPNEKRFFFVDDWEIDNNEVTFFFETIEKSKGFQCWGVSFGINKKILIFNPKSLEPELTNEGVNFLTNE
jgi:hypothetical protein